MGVKDSRSVIRTGLADPLLVGVLTVARPNLKHIASNFPVGDVDAFVAVPLKGVIRQGDLLAFRALQEQAKMPTRTGQSAQFAVPVLGLSIMRVPIDRGSQLECNPRWIKGGCKLFFLLVPTNGAVVMDLNMTQPTSPEDTQIIHPLQFRVSDFEQGRISGRPDLSVLVGMSFEFTLNGSADLLNTATFARKPLNLIQCCSSTAGIFILRDKWNLAAE
ncbi:hypothetical protein B0H13DRAFT_2282879 [Mycena leptocephala]|nr:hypothetical protein B0H13DRAFT_2282879 [Mycena leptocephala]